MGGGTACSVVGWCRAVAVMSLWLAGGAGGARPPCRVDVCGRCTCVRLRDRSVGRSIDWRAVVHCMQASWTGGAGPEIPTHDSSKPFNNNRRTRTRGKKEERGRSGPDGLAAAACISTTAATASSRSRGPAPALGLRIMGGLRLPLLLAWPPPDACCCRCPCLMLEGCGFCYGPFLLAAAVCVMEEDRGNGLKIMVVRWGAANGSKGKKGPGNPRPSVHQ